MKHADFSIGTEFQTSTGQRWRCTDVGQRSIVAIELQQDLDEPWFQGPPYPVPEVVFDELDIAAAFRTIEEHILDAKSNADSGVHQGYPNEAVKIMMKARLRDDARSYPRPKALRSDRVAIGGEILHPYAAECTPEGWLILVYTPLTQEFSALPESTFVRLRPVSFSRVTPEDFLGR